MIELLKKIHRLFSQIFFDPISVIVKWRALPVFIINIFKYNKLNNKQFSISVSDLNFRTYDKYEKAGSIGGHYLLQDLWAAREIYKSKTIDHVDLGSRIDGFVTHLLLFCKVTYIDIRDAESSLEDLTFKKGSITDLPFQDNSINSLSCLHVLEHIGLGRYGDQMDPLGYKKAADEMTRVLKNDGILYFSTPVGKERLYFDAHRVFNPLTIIDAFKSLELIEFHLIDDEAKKIIYNADFEQCKHLNYGCGLFKFTKVN